LGGAASRAIRNNDLIDAIGDAKVKIQKNQFETPDFLLMSPTLNNDCSKADTFTASNKRSGTDTNMSGDLQAVKDVDAYGTNAPNIDLGDERVIVGVKGSTSYVVAKPWTMSEMVEGRNAAGNLNGTKEAYGEEYNCITTPLPLRKRYTSVLWYSASGR